MEHQQTDPPKVLVSSSKSGTQQVGDGFLEVTKPEVRKIFQSSGLLHRMFGLFRLVYRYPTDGAMSVPHGIRKATGFALWVFGSVFQVLFLYFMAKSPPGPGDLALLFLFPALILSISLVFNFVAGILLGSESFGLSGNLVLATGIQFLGMTVTLMILAWVGSLMPIGYLLVVLILLFMLVSVTYHALVQFFVWTRLLKVRTLAAAYVVVFSIPVSFGAGIGLFLTFVDFNSIALSLPLVPTS